MSMSNDRSKTTASVSHFTHNGIRAGDPLEYLCSTVCLLAIQLSAAQLSSHFLLVLETKRQKKDLLEESSWRSAGGGGEWREEEEVEEENYFCAAPAAVQWWRRCTDLHEIITRFDDRGTITKLRQQRQQQQQPSCLCGPLIAKLCCLSTCIFRVGLGSNRRVPARLQKHSVPKWRPASLCSVAGRR